MNRVPHGGVDDPHHDERDDDPHHDGRDGQEPSTQCGGSWLDSFCGNIAVAMETDLVVFHHKVHHRMMALG